MPNPSLTANASIPILTEIVDPPLSNKRMPQPSSLGDVSLDALLLPLKESMLSDIQSRALPLIEARLKEQIPVILEQVMEDSMRIFKQEIANMLEETIKNHTQDPHL